MENNEGTTGCVVRDYTVNLVRDQAIWYDQGASALAMEAEAIRDGVKLAADMGLQDVIVESDALEVVNLLKDPDASRSLITSICQEIKERSRVFSSFEINHVNMLANIAAHSCAHRASATRRRCL
jgi:ribonuclease HI